MSYIKEHNYIKTRRYALNCWKSLVGGNLADFSPIFHIFLKNNFKEIYMNSLTDQKETNKKNENKLYAFTIFLTRKHVWNLDGQGGSRV